MKKTYLVTGGTGFIGRNLVRQLVTEGYSVKVFDDNSRGNLDSLKDIFSNIEFIASDIRNYDAVKKACKNVDGVVHLAAINGTKFFYTIPELVLDVSTRGIINIIDACLWHGVEELFFASSSEVYHVPLIVPTPENVPLVIPDHLNPRFSYAAGKIISEMYVLNYGKKYFRRAIIFRPHNVYGPQMGWEHVIPQFILRLKKSLSVKKDPIPFPIQGNGNETRSFVYIDDFIDGLTTILKKGESLNTYNIGAPEEVKIKDVALEVAKFYDRKIRIIPGKLAAGGTNRRLPDISKIVRLGYKPKVKFAEGIRNTTRWYNANAHLMPILEII